MTQISEDVRLLIAARKAEALKLLERNKLTLTSASPATLPSTGNDSDASAIGDNFIASSSASNELICRECGGTEYIDSFFKQHFNIEVCKVCLAVEENDYSLIPKAVAIDMYLLPESVIRKMKFFAKENPKRKGWTEMKLYVKRLAREEGILLHGSLENIALEKSRRNEAKFNRSLESVASTFSKLRKKRESADMSVGNLGKGDVVTKKAKGHKSNILKLVAALTEDSDDAR